MVWDLKNKVVVITGGGDGIGYSIAEKYLENGAKITIILDINEVIGEEAVKKLKTKYGNDKAIFIKCDVTKDIETVSKKIFDSYTVDVLVNSAGMINDSLPKKTIDLNLTALIELSFKFWEHMRKDKGGNGGTIFNISSIYGVFTDQFFPVYQASKHGVLAFSRSLGHEANYEKSSVRVLTLCPGFTETKLTATFIMWDNSSTKIDELAKFTKSQPWQKVDAVGNAAVEVFYKAKSGTAWEIIGGQPICEVPN